MPCTSIFAVDAKTEDQVAYTSGQPEMYVQSVVEIWYRKTNSHYFREITKLNNHMMRGQSKEKTLLAFKKIESNKKLMRAIERAVDDTLIVVEENCFDPYETDVFYETIKESYIAFLTMLLRDGKISVEKN